MCFANLHVAISRFYDRIALPMFVIILVKLLAECLVVDLFQLSANDFRLYASHCHFDDLSMLVHRIVRKVLRNAS